MVYGFCTGVFLYQSKKPLVIRMNQNTDQSIILSRAAAFGVYLFFFFLTW